MKYNYFFLLLILFVSFPLFSIDESKNSRGKLKAKSLPVSPVSSPYILPKKPLSRKMSAFDLGDQMDCSPNEGPIFSFITVSCTTCGESILDKLMGDHSPACAAAKQEELHNLSEFTQQRPSSRGQEWRERVKMLQQADQGQSEEYNPAAEEVAMDED